MSRNEAGSFSAFPVPVLPTSLLEAVQLGATELAARRSVLAVPMGEWHCWMTAHGYPTYRARQVLNWIIRRRAKSFELMSDLPKRLRLELDEQWKVFSTCIAYHNVAADGTDKLVLESHDGRRTRVCLNDRGPTANRLLEYPGWMCDGLRLLAQRAQWGRAKLERRGDPGTGTSLAEPLAR